MLICLHFVSVEINLAQFNQYWERIHQIFFWCIDSPSMTKHLDDNAWEQISEICQFISCCCCFIVECCFL